MKRAMMSRLEVSHARARRDEQDVRVRVTSRELESDGRLQREVSASDVGRRDQVSELEKEVVDGRGRVALVEEQLETARQAERDRSKSTCPRADPLHEACSAIGEMLHVCATAARFVWSDHDHDHATPQIG
eukprot:355052-Rhodomonas_salina.1